MGQRLAVGWACIEEGVKRGVAGLKGEVGVFLGKVFFLHLVMLHFRGPLKRGFLLPEERPKNVVFDGGMQVFFSSPPFCFCFFFPVSFSRAVLSLQNLLLFCMVNKREYFPSLKSFFEASFPHKSSKRLEHFFFCFLFFIPLPFFFFLFSHLSPPSSS